AGQIFNVIHMADPDIVLAGDGATVLGIGRIAGDYRYAPSHPVSHQRPAEWLPFGDRKLDPYEGPQRTVQQPTAPRNRVQTEQRTAVLGDGAWLGLVRAVTFHPAYGYEDFLEGYRPVLAGEQMAFERRDGIFKRLCQDAERASDRRFYLLIDEINRGDIPRIF